MSASTRNIIAWVLQGLAGLAFIFIGGMKVKDLSATLENFTKMGFPAWFGYLIAFGELLGGIGLLIPRTVRLAAAGLIIIMAGAVYMHLFKIPNGAATVAPAAALLVILVVILLLRRLAPNAV
ncbi:DoxX family protein [Hymenobacter sp. ASUV-10]|uniref:DoxX family protein n=1 Tax=Hymenobacter aranciens TaxID=3063996 RepID=A0ABT9BBR9_9BACT|nr:DoxX family protein [Hymenobacter sp. ASUV-10]MDO7875716.1 DoxX family protein [Hymenobacter sp. ASUV-10]